LYNDNKKIGKMQESLSILVSRESICKISGDSDLQPEVEVVVCFCIFLIE
jgi:hypothetical protein